MSRISFSMVQYVPAVEKPRPRFVEPMECTRVAKLPEGRDWIYEVKQDGYRVIGVVAESSAQLYTFSGNNYTDQFPSVALALRELRQGNLIVDGEIVALDGEGRANFQELQNRRKTRLPIVYYVFDLLHWDGRDLMSLPLELRKKSLAKLAAKFREPLRLNEAFDTELGPLVEQVKRLGLEGIVAKRKSSIYIPGKLSDGWQKRRFNQEDEFVIGGYVIGGRNFSSLIVGEYRGKDLYYVKRVTGGFTPPLRDDVMKELKPLRTRKCPFVNLPEPGHGGHGLTADKMSECVWLKPERRCEVEFVERTASGRLRHATFRRLVS